MSKIIVSKVTGVDLAKRAIETTSRAVETSNATLDMIYRWEHSPMRTQMFWIEMQDIPTFVSVHTVRHKIWVEHYVLSNRIDRGGTGEENRYTPVNHGMFLNAEALISMARKRLCYQASKETRKIMTEIREGVAIWDPDLAKYMVPNCVYRGGLCVEPNCCQIYPNVRRYDPVKELQLIKEVN